MSPASRHEINADRLDAFLREQVKGLSGPMRLERIGGGQSNPTYFLHFDERSLVLRTKPAGPVLPSAHAIDREYRIMGALAATSLPVPPVVLYHAEADVLDTAFYLMEKVPGRVFNDASLPGMDAAERRAIYLAMADTMACLHRVDWRAAGLEGFGKTDGFFARQLRRWRQQWELSRQSDRPELDRLLNWLDTHLPSDDLTSIVHGDFKLNNLLFHPSEAKVVAVLDWELSTLGNPLADVAFNTIAWRTLPEEYGGILGLDWTTLGIPDENEYLHRYYAQAHHAARASAFHWAFAFMRWSVIFEGIAARARNGNATSSNAAEVGELGSAFARRGLESIDRSPPA